MARFSRRVLPDNRRPGGGTQHHGRARARGGRCHLAGRGGPAAVVADRWALARLSPRPRARPGALRWHPDPGDPETVEGLDELSAEEPRVGSQRQRANGTSAADPGDEFFDEALVATLGGTLAQPGVQDLAGVGPRGH